MRITLGSVYQCLPTLLNYVRIYTLIVLLQYVALILPWESIRTKSGQ